MALNIVIMAGGKGERLWPLSREGKPKQLLSFGSRQSLLRNTFERTATLTQPEHVYVVTNAEIADEVSAQLPELPKKNILAEPVGRNTAPCIAYAAAVISIDDPDAVMAIFPSDHIIGDPMQFAQTVEFAVDALENNPELLITLGMIPDHPETGYGYIAPGEILQRDNEFVLHKINTFHEKPEKERAQEYIEKKYLWNAGMFLWRVDAILQEFRDHLPVMYKDLMEFRSALSKQQDDPAAFYGKVEPVSIDYGVMEKTQHAAVIPAEFGWNDIGSWDALGNVLPRDDKANVTHGSVIIKESKRNVIWSTGKKIVAIGIEDLVVAEGDDAILICPRDKSQGLSTILKNIKK
jgi:mannose-1-phosphate guanylyltransferase